MFKGPKSSNVQYQSKIIIFYRIIKTIDKYLSKIHYSTGSGDIHGD